MADLDNIVIPAEIQDSIYIDENTKLVFVAEGKEKDFYFLSFVSALKKMGLYNGTKTVSMQEIRELWKKQRKKTNKDITITIKDAINLFRDAYNKNASDIHIRIDNYEKIAYVFFRINGGLQKQAEWDSQYANSLCSTIYGAMADVADSTYTPSSYQDARIARSDLLPEGLHGIRISSGPHVNGSFMVMRLLYETTLIESGSIEDRLKALGYNNNHIKNINFMRKKPTGIIIIAGATGSGKSTTLKHVLESISKERPDLHILTVEDPPEYPMAGVVQMPVVNAGDSESRQEAFVRAIRSAMRSDPDIIMVGEIRDHESARLSLQAAMTGHQVWTTLHANSSFNIINRLVDIISCPEIPEPLKILADITILSGLIYQRLVKVLCPHCKKPLIKNIDNIPKSFLNRLAQILDLSEEKDNPSIFIKGDGCAKCNGTGIAGRTVLAEVVNTDPNMLDILRKDGLNEARKYWIKNQKGRPILYHALEKIKQGIVDPMMVENDIGMLTSEIIIEDGLITQEEIEDNV